MFKQKLAVEAAKKSALHGVEAAKANAAHGLEIAKANAAQLASQGLDIAKSNASHGLDIAKANAAYGLDVAKSNASQLATQGLDVALTEAERKVKKLRGYLPAKEVEKKPSAFTRLLHDLGLAVWFGGSVFGILSLNPSVEVLDDPEERGKMVDEAWARFQPYGAAGLLLVFITHIVMRRRGPKNATSNYKTLALLKDLFIVGAGVTSVASLALGEYAVDDYTPVESATEPSDETPEDKESAQSGLSIASIAQLACGVGLIVCGALLASERDKSR